MNPDTNLMGYESTSGQNMYHQIMYEAHHNLLDIIPNLADNELGKIRDDDLESKSGSENLEGVSGDDQDPNQRSKRFRRHTKHQIQVMESFFKECPHPDDKQREHLSRKLGLEPLQVKFWFQNKRTQVKTNQERHGNSQLRAENEKLRAEIIWYNEALAAASCQTCGGPTVINEISFDDQHLKMENSQLREEIDRISAIAAQYVGKPVGSYPLVSPQITPPELDLPVGNCGMQQRLVDVYHRDDILRSVNASGEEDKLMIIELAVAAMEELLQMAHIGEPLWEQYFAHSSPTVNEDQYLRLFPREIGPKAFGYKSESSRESLTVMMNPVGLVEILMDVGQWQTMFSSIVSRAETTQVLSAGFAGNRNGALQVMNVEFQLPSPLVPTRESLFLRYCRNHSNGMWAVVDVSIDHLRPGPVMRCQRRPSGCVIQEYPNGYIKVIWIEHVEVDDSRPVHSLYEPLANSSLGFGAKRWVSALGRQCERFTHFLTSNMRAGDVGGKKSLLKLAERMVMIFCNSVSASTVHTWTSLSGVAGVDVKVMTEEFIDCPGRPSGNVLTAATSLWLPIEPKTLFDFLRDVHTRSEWDILSKGGVLQELEHIANGGDPGNCISLLRVNSVNSSQSNMLILQEGITDAAASFVVHAPVGSDAMSMVLRGGDPEYIPLIPSGFAILHDGQTMNREVSRIGSLLTVAFQIVVDSAPTKKLSLGSMETINKLISCTVESIRASIGV